ncbi:hypothetical protein MTE1_4905 [Klebsiella pneumoniae JHCK1]|nr:hypothetical protein MTE1_4905 [Klebsiella pneumoniae JHCK1]
MIANRQGIHFFDETVRARLHNDKLILVVTDISRDCLGIIQHSSRDFLRF